MVRAEATEPSQPVRGRDDDFATVGRHLDQLLTGIGWVIVVEGAAGLGKSRLLNEAATMARRMSIKVGSGAPLAADVTFASPLLTAEARGKSVSERILIAASRCYGEQKFRAVLQVEDQPAIAAVFDGIIEAKVLQLVAIFKLNTQREVSEIRVFSRAWPVTAYLRRCIEGPLPIR